MTEVLAAGAVLWRPEMPGAVEIAVVHRPRYDDWSLPKGKLEPGETKWAAAVREVGEETGFRAVLGRYLGQLRYPITRPVATKVVDYFAARTVSGEFAANEEVDSLRWLPVDEALTLLTRQGEREIVLEFSGLPADTTTLALVRHAKAGDRRSWPGADELRPLSKQGWRQAAALRPLLPLFGVNRVHSTPLLRCIQTVQGLAEDLRTPIIEEPLLSERAYPANVPEAVARLEEIVAAGGTPVVCSQGGVIPDLLSRVAESSAVSLENPPCAKGSVWILSFAEGPKLVAADYIAKP